MDSVFYSLTLPYRVPKKLETRKREKRIRTVCIRQDYEMNLYIRMAWRDPRLAHNYTLPILIKEEELLGLIWKPDPYFANAKEADYHDVTFLNFLMIIMHEGEVYYETRYRI